MATPPLISSGELLRKPPSLDGGGVPVSIGRLWLVTAVLIGIEVLASFENAMVITALPKINSHYNDLAWVSWLITAFVMAQAGTAAIGGRLGDMFGRRRVLLAIVCICGLGSLLCAVTTDLRLMIAGRALQGLSGAILPLCYGMIRDIAPPREVPVMVGWLTGAYAFAHAIGFALGGILADAGWQLIFSFNAAFAAILLVPMMIVLPRTQQTFSRDKIDWAGLFFVPGITAVLFGITLLAARNGNLVVPFGWISAGVLILIFWARHEWVRSEPLLDVKLLIRREILLPNLCFALIAVGAAQAPLIMMMLLQQPFSVGIGLGVSAAVAGFAKFPSGIAGSIASPVAGFLCRYWSSRRVLLLGAGICGAAALLLMLFHGTVLEVIVATAFIAIGTNMILTGVPNLVLDATPVARSSEATGLSMVIKATFLAVGVQWMTGLLSSSRVTDPASGRDYPSSEAFMLTFATLAVTAALIGMLSLLMRTSQQSSSASAKVEA